MQTLSKNALAVLILLNAQRQVCDRFDGSWWLLDFAKWELVPTLRGDEWKLVLTLIAACNQRRAESIETSPPNWYGVQSDMRLEVPTEG
jgi:hypothetical protein